MAAAVGRGEGALLRPRNMSWGWAVGAEAGARLWEDDGHVGWGSTASLPCH